MKGVIFNIVKSFVEDNFGEKAYEELIEQSNLKSNGIFIGPATYDDSDFFELATQATNKFSVSMNDLQKMLGKYSFPKLATMCPHFVEIYDHPKAFLKTIEDVVHVEVKKLYLNANTPTFRYEDNSDDSLMMEYMSERQLCFFLDGLIDGVSDYFKQPISKEHSTCTHRGDLSCRFMLSF